VPECFLITEALGCAPGLKRPQHCYRRVQDWGGQMEPERARELLSPERLRIEQALARLSLSGGEELAGQDAARGEPMSGGRH
jgi:hypothetical protein